jgi:hypothetical protein
MYPSNWPFGEGLFSVVVYAWLGLQGMSYGFGYGSLWTLARLVHATGISHPPLPLLQWPNLRFPTWRPTSSSLTPEEGVILAIKYPPQDEPL